MNKYEHTKEIFNMHFVTIFITVLLFLSKVLPNKVIFYLPSMKTQHMHTHRIHDKHQPSHMHVQYMHVYSQNPIRHIRNSHNRATLT